LDLVQLHGDESPADIAALGSIPVMKAFRPTSSLVVIEYLNACTRLGCQPRMVLLDANVPGEFGGTGHRADWDIAQQYQLSLPAPPLVLAGGLTPANVGEAIRAVRPAAVDTASGVESAPGRKDPERIARFVAAARAAFGQRE
jgi:phosphoribosylanthranilate isomerase